MAVKARMKCCSKARARMKKVAYAKAVKAASTPLGPDGRFSSKVAKKKATAKKAKQPRKAKPCQVCGK